MRVHLRQNDLCPDANGTIVGQAQGFTLMCGANFDDTETLKTVDAPNIQGCIEQCAFFHPKCGGVTFSRGERCRLKGPVGRNDVRTGSRFFDAAVAIFPPALASTCENGNRGVSGADSTFNLFCGQISDGGDMGQAHHATIDGCMRDCANTSGCTGFSFDADMDQGFMNCYKKSSITQGGLQPLTGIDSGIVVAAAAASSSSTTQGAVPLVSTVSGSSPTTTPESVEEATTAGGTFFTINPAPVASQVVTAITSETTIAVITSESTIISVTQVVPITITTFTPVSETASGQNSSAASTTGMSSSLSWVAAPVVGGIAAVLVLVIMFVMFRRRQNESGSSWRWRPSFAFAHDKHSSTLPPTNWGTSKWAFWRQGAPAERINDDEGPVAEKGSIPRYEVKAGRAELRDDQHPLRQNRPSGVFSTSSTSESR